MTIKCKSCPAEITWHGQAELLHHDDGSHTIYRAPHGLTAEANPNVVELDQAEAEVHA